MPGAQDFRDALDRILREAEKGADHIDVTSHILHGSLGGYPGPEHRMPVCCEIMRQAMHEGDEILQAPPKGNGASLVIRYRLPR